VDWDKCFDEHLVPYEKEKRRGKSVKVTAEQVRLIVELAQKKQEKEERLLLGSFVQEVNMAGGLTLGKETLREILIANDLRAVHTRVRRPVFYKNLCKRIPNSLLSIDGSEIELNINGESCKFNLEFGVDVSSFAHTGFDIKASETSQAVLAVLKQHIKKYGFPLGVVFDHGTANLSEDVRTWLLEHDIEIVPAGPGNPKGNGTAEGAFSQLKKVLGAIEIDSSTPQNLGKTVLTALVSLYVEMRNRLPLRKSGITPQVAIAAEASEEVRQKERARLIKHNQNRQDSGEEQRNLETLHWIIQEHNLDVDTPSFRRAEYSIKFYSTEAILKTEKAFLKAVTRNSDRKNLSYFFGILKNIQQDLDDAQYHEYCREKYYYKSLLESEKRQRENTGKQSKPSFRVIVDLAAAAINVSESIQKVVRDRCKRWLDTHLKSSKYLGSIKKKIQDAIGELAEFDTTTKKEVWDWIEPLLSK
jgi:transposase InsO family protein